MTRTGLALPLNLALPVRQCAEIAAQAESLGYTRVWAAEAGNNDAFGLLTACALATTRVELATGVLPIFTRTPALMAQSAATLQDVSGGRFTLGLGVSSPVIVTAWNGLPYDQLMSRTREYVDVVRALLSGEKVEHDGPLYPVAGYRLLMHVPSPASRIALAALNPQMLALSGEVADEVLLNWIGLDAVPAAVATMREAADAAGGRDVRTCAFVRVCVTDDVETARAWGRREVMGYVIVPAYRRAFERHGWADACATAMTHWNAGERKEAAASLPTAFVDSLCIAGPADEVRERFDAFRAAGVDEPVAFLFSGQREPAGVLGELQATLTALAPTGTG